MTDFVFRLDRFLAFACIVILLICLWLYLESIGHYISALDFYQRSCYVKTGWLP